MQWRFLVVLLAVTGPALAGQEADREVARPPTVQQERGPEAAYHLELARVHVRFGKLAEAKAELARAEAAAGAEAVKGDILLLRADMAMQEGRPAETAAAYEQAIKVAESDAQRQALSHKLAEIRMQSGRPADAAAIYERLASATSEFWERHRFLELGLVAHQRAGTLERKMIALKETLARTPADEQSLQAVFILHWRITPDLDKAIAAAEKLFKLRPDDPVLTGAVAQMHVQAGRFEEAVAAYEKLAEAQPESRAEIQEQIAQVWLRARDPERAAQAAMKATEAKPDDWHVWTRSGSILLQCGQPEQAVAACLKAVEKCRTAEEKGIAMLQLAAMHERLKQVEQARLVYTQLVESGASEGIREQARRNLAHLVDEPSPAAE